MAVYKRTYRAYTGPLTNPAWRFLVLQRYALNASLDSSLLWALVFGGCAAYLAYSQSNR